jgi:hypothetical protein
MVFQLNNLKNRIQVQHLNQAAPACERRPHGPPVAHWALHNDHALRCAPTGRARCAP